MRNVLLNNMCFLVNLVLEQPKLVLYLILIGMVIRTYNHSNKMTENIKATSIRINRIDAVIKNITIKIKLLKVNLEQVQNDKRKLKSEIKLQRRDMTGQIDYAYGGKVISIGNTVTFSNENEGIALFGFKVCGQPHLERRILESSMMPGNCWPINGYEGSAVIELIKYIVVSHVTLQHAPKELLPNGANKTAPKEFSLWGLHDDGRAPHFFGQFTYTMTWPEVQTFPIQYSCKTSFKNVEFKVHSNHGSEHYTCIYRLRIHGQ